MWERIKNTFRRRDEQERVEEHRSSGRTMDRRKINTKVTYKYPRHAPFRFPVIPDEESEQQPAYMRRHTRNVEQRKRPKAQKRTTPFTPSQVASPIYGYNSRRKAQEIENLPAFMRKRKEREAEQTIHVPKLQANKRIRHTQESSTETNHIHKQNTVKQQGPNVQPKNIQKRQQADEASGSHSNVVQITSEQKQVTQLEQIKLQRETKRATGEHELERIPLTLLNNPVKQNSEDERWVEEQKNLLEETLSHFNVQAKVVNATQGPTVTRFEVQPELGVKVSRVRNLSDDIKMNMAAKDIRIEAPIPGKNTIGIEVPNLNATVVGLQEIFKEDEFQQHESPLSIGLGLSIEGTPHITTIDQMPHGLIAGATGSGKSVCINTILISLLYKASHEDVKLLLIDPKMVELAPYNDIPHLVSPVITDVKAATAALKWAVAEMEDRYERFVEAGVRDIHRYNEKMAKQTEDKMPHIVIVIDELADLMMASPQDVEDAICRIAQKARACGMHLLLATQRPSVDVITGLIKANIPTRIAFSVSSQVDSRTIIDTNGAEKLLGKGDMLFIENGSGKSVRLQGAFVSDDEIERVTEHVKSFAKPHYLFQQDELLQQVEADEEVDELFEDVIQFILEHDQASTSLLQRQFRIGYNRAARLIDTLESKGMISEQNGSKPRNVLFTIEQLDEFI